MTAPGRPGIDHPLVLVRDIERARDAYAALGFTLTPVGLHPWGTSTSLAVLNRSAIELMGIYDDTLLDALSAGPFRFGRHMHDALAEREGMSLVALHGTDAVAQGAALGVDSQGTIGFRRRVRPPGREWEEAVVTLSIHLDAALPRASHFIAQQHRPELLWVPEWMRHANGATHVAAVTYLADDPEPVLSRLTAMFGPAHDSGPGWAVTTGQGEFRVLRPRDWAAEFGAAPPPTLTPGQPGGAAIDIAVARPDAASAACTAPLTDTPRGPATTEPARFGNVTIRFVA